MMRSALLRAPRVGALELAGKFRQLQSVTDQGEHTAARFAVRASEWTLARTFHPGVQPEPIARPVLALDRRWRNWRS